jgi:hypothetical protein
VEPRTAKPLVSWEPVACPEHSSKVLLEGRCSCQSFLNKGVFLNQQLDVAPDLPRKEKVVSFYYFLATEGHHRYPLNHARKHFLWFLFADKKPEVIHGHTAGKRAEQEFKQSLFNLDICYYVLPLEDRVSNKSVSSM